MKFLYILQQLKEEAENMMKKIDLLETSKRLIKDLELYS